MTLRLASLLGVALLFLSACGDNTLQSLRTQAGALIGRSPPPVDVRAFLTPEVLEQLGQPILLMLIEDRDIEFGAIKASTKRGYETWNSNDNVSFTFQKGLLTATRGLGGDLISSDLNDVIRGVHSGASSGVRLLNYLTVDDQIQKRAFACTYARTTNVAIKTHDRSYTTTRVDEDCTSTIEKTQNTYWIDRRGIIRMSRQWVGPYAGYISYELLND